MYSNKCHNNTQTVNEVCPDGIPYVLEQAPFGLCYFIRFFKINSKNMCYRSISEKNKKFLVVFCYKNINKNIGISIKGIIDPKII